MQHVMKLNRDEAVPERETVVEGGAVMVVKVFGVQAQRVGGREVRVRVAGEPVTVGAVRRALAGQVPALADSLAGSRLAVDLEYAAEDLVIAPGQELALIGLVGGG